MKRYSSAGERMSEELPDEIEVELEKAPSKDPEEVMQRYVEAVERISTATGEFPPYHVEMTGWGEEGGPVRSIKLSTHVQIPRAMLKALLTFRGILREFKEDVKEDVKEDEG